MLHIVVVLGARIQAAQYGARLACYECFKSPALLTPVVKSDKLGDTRFMRGTNQFVLLRHVIVLGARIRPAHCQDARRMIIDRLARFEHRA